MKQPWVLAGAAEGDATMMLEHQDEHTYTLR
jgi:hypothetical protein